MSRDVMYMWHVPDPFIGAQVTFEGVFVVGFAG